MKKVILILVLAVSSSLYADQYVNGYTKSNGTYVQGYTRSSPNSTTSDNYSTKGNTNPYTGQEGTRNPTSSSGNSNYGSSYGNSNPYGNNKSNSGY